MNFEKMANSKEENRRLLRELGIIGLGTGVGAGAGYGTGYLLKRRYGKQLEGMDPRKRLKYLGPAAAGAGGVAALVHTLRERERVRGRKKK
jgi:hypothetical protein